MSDQDQLSFFGENRSMFSDYYLTVAGDELHLRKAHPAPRRTVGSEGKDRKDGLAHRPGGGPAVWVE